MRDKGDIVIVTGWGKKPLRFIISEEEGKRRFRHISPPIDRSIRMHGPRGGWYWLTHNMASAAHSAFWEMRSLNNRFGWKKVTVKFVKAEGEGE